MTEPEYETVDANSLSTEEIIAAMWEAGDLSFLMHPSQLECRNKIHAWRLLDQTNDVDKVAGSMPRVFCVAKSGRWGGTTLVLWLYFELACWFVRTYGKPMRLRFTSAWQKSIDEIVGAVAPQCFDTAPPGCVPQYWGKRGTRPAGLYFPEYGPAGGTSIALAGLDVNPNATRGQASDGDVVSEAAFVDKLDYTLRSVLYRQYQGRPWARAIVESSAPKDLDTDWERIYVPDCKRRGAFFAATIEDNTRLTRAEKDEFISAAGGRGNANCEREYFNIISGDPQMVVFPEFDESKHVRDIPIPEHAVGVTADDPGLSHLNGLSLAHYDFDAATIVFRSSWAGVNAGSMKLAAAVAAREFLLWGTWPHTKMCRIPLESTRDQVGWRDLLARDEFAHMAEELYEMAQVPEEQRPDFENFPGKWIRNDLPGHSTYWDGREHKKNPAARVSDVDLGLIRDIDDHYGLEFTATNKSELHTMVNLVRSYLAQGRMVFLPGSGPIIDHMRACKWNKQRTKFDSHPVWGHYDVAASAVYLTRLIDQRFQNLRPHPPEGLAQLQGHAGNSVVNRLPWAEKQPHELELERRLAQAGIRTQGGRMKSWR